MKFYLNNDSVVLGNLQYNDYYDRWVLLQFLLTTSKEDHSMYLNDHYTFILEIE